MASVRRVAPMIRLATWAQADPAGMVCAASLVVVPLALIFGTIRLVRTLKDRRNRSLGRLPERVAGPIGPRVRTTFWVALIGLVAALLIFIGRMNPHAGRPGRPRPRLAPP